MKGVLRAYKTAGQNTAKLIKRYIAEDLITPTAKAYAPFQKMLKQAAEKIAAELESTIPATAKGAAEKTSDIQAKLLSDAAETAGAKITKAGIRQMYFGVNDDVVRDIVNRISQKGYTFAKRIWNTAGDFPEQMNRVVAAGVAQGRDALDIAGDVTAYVKDGKPALIQRYGKLKRGTAEFTRRISDDVSWKALRLVRSELYMSLQNASVAQAKASPATDGKCDWVLSGGGQHSCVCSDLADNSPYSAGKVPSYPHPNCRCTIVPKLRDGTKFNADLKRWADGESVGYIDKWYADYYVS